MRNPEKVLNSLSDHSNNSEYKYERLYRILFNRDMYLAAYQKIYANEGNMTKGSDGKNIDGMSLERIDSLIELLKNEKYQPNPSRRVYIRKKDGKRLRPLGIPAFNDKLVQEVIKMILEAVYEKSFDASSHGFRPKRSCHTALLQIQAKFTGVKWFIEGDIKGFFDNIDHDVMISLLRKRIKDERFLRLIRKFMNAGYLEEWEYHKTYSGTPQGGIISPILANIYLNELDKYMNAYKEKFDIGRERKRNSEYRKIEVQRGKLAKELKNCTDENIKQQIIGQIKLLEQIRCDVPVYEAMDGNFKRIQYVRYADDFLIGVIGSKADCMTIKSDIRKFLSEQLKLELSDEKTLITHAQKSAHFLGFGIYIRQSNLPKRDKLGRMVRNYGSRVVLEITTDTIRRKLLEYKAMKITYVNGKEIWKPTARYSLKNNDDLEILDKYNTEIRGFYNFYSIANNSSVINSFKYIMEYSMYKTYATKYRTNKRKIIKKFHIGKEFGIRYKVKSGREKVRLFYNEGFKRKKTAGIANVDNLPNCKFHLGSTSLIDRLKSNKCEMCGVENMPIEIHHVRKLKDLKGKKYWERFMIARNRKTIALCRDCHIKLHHGLLD